MPFTTEQFLNIFKDYNTTVFPMQITLIILACSIIGLLFSRLENRHKFISLILSFLWMWIGIVYHILFFSKINPVAFTFGFFFILQSLIFLFWGVYKGRIIYNIRNDSRGIIGWVLIIYSLLVYPSLGYLLGHGYPYQPTFGLPCPTTIFTFGLLIFSLEKSKIFILIIPLLWAIIASTAALKLGILEDIGLPVAAILSFVIMLSQKKLIKV